MAADRAADVFRQVEEPARSELLSRLDPESSARRSAACWSTPPNTAGSIMTTEFVSVPSSWTVAQALAHIRKVERTRETIYAIYVLDPASRRLLRAVTLRRLITAEPEAPILSAARPQEPITVTGAGRPRGGRCGSSPNTTCSPFRWWTAAGHVLGIVTVDDVIDAILEESSEDVQKFGGMAAIEEPYLQIGFGYMIRKRAGWLCALFISEMLTRERDAVVPVRARQGVGPVAVHPADHELRRQFRLAGRPRF